MKEEMQPPRKKSIFGLRGIFRLAGKASGWSGMLLAGLALFVPSKTWAAAPVPSAGNAQPGYLPSAQPNVLSQGILQRPMDAPPAGPMDQGKALPISLDTVFRLAQDQNGKIAIAREQLNEAFAGKDIADKSWIPDLFVGTTYFRHEGGIQDFQGFLVHSSYGSYLVGPTIQGTFDLRDFGYKKIDAERKIWQQRGEVSKLTAENLLDAASTYIDFLAARSAEAQSLKFEQEMQKLLVPTEKLAKVERPFMLEVVRIKAELDGQKQVTRKMRESVRAAAAKLIYLLGLDPESELVPVDPGPIYFSLVDDSIPAPRLVDLALSQGPGVQDMSGLLSLIEEADAKSHGLGRFIPVVKLCLTEGAFGAGPGPSTTWDNAFNGCVSIGWNLNEWCIARERRRVLESKKMQAQLGFQELTSKLTLGVQEALESSRSNREQKNFGHAQVKEALESYRLSEKRWENKIGWGTDAKTRTIPASPGEVLMALGNLARAEFNLINSVREHDKAQLRLFVLTGQVEQHAHKE
jgi:outer membrane protein TolC